MKKLFCVIIMTFVVGIALQGCGLKHENESNSQLSEPMQTITSDNQITKELAYRGIDNYCHSMYDWSIAADNPSIMYLEMGEESESEYQLIFHSYTGALEYFYIDKSNGTTRMAEYVPTLGIESDAGTINLYDYLKPVRILPPQGVGQIGLSAVVISEKLPVYQNPDANSEVVNTLEYGNFIILLRQSDGWAEYVRSDSVDEVPGGWIETDRLLIDPAWIFTNERTPLYAQNDETASEIALLDENTIMPIIEDEGDWLLVSLEGTNGWIYNGMERG